MDLAPRKKISCNALTIGGLKCKQPCNLLYEFTVSRVSKMSMYDEGYSISRCGIIRKNFHNKAFMPTRATPGQPNDCTNLNFPLEKEIVNIVDPFRVSPEHYLKVDENLCLFDTNEEALLEATEESKVAESTQVSKDFDGEHLCERAPDIGNFFIFHEIIPTSIQLILKLCSLIFAIFHRSDVFIKRFGYQAEVGSATKHRI